VNISELEFLVLVSLAGQRRHGYGILRDIEDISDGVVRPQVATLYRQLDRLDGQGLIAEAGGEVVDGRFRRYYQLTDRGADVLDAAVTSRGRTNAVAKRRRATRSAAVEGAT
jgi:DNA-binding PadR family transcriptional regulator